MTTHEIEAVEECVMGATLKLQALTSALTKAHGDPTAGLRDHLGTLEVNVRVLLNACEAASNKIDRVRS